MSLALRTCDGTSTRLAAHSLRARAEHAFQSRIDGYRLLVSDALSFCRTDLAPSHDAGVCKVGPTAAEARNRNGDRTAAVRSGRLRRDSEVVRWGLETIATREIGRTVHVEGISANPFTLRVTLRGLTVDGAPGESAPLLTVRELTANASSASLLLPGASAGRAQH